MLKPQAFANAVAVVGLALYVVCRVIALIAPDLLFNVGQSWFHTFSLNAVKTTSTFDLGTFLFGGITFSILAWVTAYATASLYNKFAK